MTDVVREKAECLRDQILKTWSPPERRDMQTEADVAQTAAMLTIAFLMGRDFLTDLTYTQTEAIRTGLPLLESITNK